MANTYDRKRGIIHIILAAFFFSLMAFFVAKAGDLPTMQKAFFRNLIAFIFAAVVLMRTEEKFKFHKSNLPFLILRSVAGLIGILANFYAVSVMNISDANMLNKLSPFFAIIFSLIILKEKPNKIEIGAVVVAFIGALFVIKPSFDASVIPALCGALGGLAAGIAYTFVRLLGTRGERGPFIVFFFSGFCTIALLPNLIINYVPMTTSQWICLLLAGCSAMGGQINVTSAYIYAPAKEISIYDYSQILFAAALGFFFMNQLPDIYSVIGYVIIIGAALFRWIYQNKKTT